MLEHVHIRKCKTSRLIAASFAIVSACSLSDLDTGDTKRPSLDACDSVSLNPSCVVVPAAPNALGGVRRLLGVRASRRSGAGAEAVPVIFTLGTCKQKRRNESFGSPTAHGSAEEGANPLPSIQSAPGPTLGTCAVEDHTSEAPQCGAVACADPWYLGQFTLTVLDPTRCKSRVTSEIECVLAPDGTMAIGVDANLVLPRLGDVVWAAPICISIRKQATDDCDGGVASAPEWYYAEANLVPDTAALLREHLEFHVVSIPPSECLSGSTCTQVTELARLTVGVVGSDAPPGAPTSLWEPVSDSVLIEASVTEDDAPSIASPVFLSKTRCSTTPDSDAGVDSSIDVSIAAGQSESPSFAVCGPPARGTYRITASVIGDHASIAGSTQVEIDHPSVVVRPLDTDSLSLEVCGEPSRLLLGSDVSLASGRRTVKITSTGALRTSDKEICSALGEEDDPDAGTTGGATSNCSGDLSLVLSTGQTCALRLRSVP